MQVKKSGNRTFEMYETPKGIKVDVIFDWGAYWNSETFEFKTKDYNYAYRQAKEKSAGM